MAEETDTGVQKPEATNPNPKPQSSDTAQEALNNRLNDFVKEYGELVKKHNVDFATYPMFIPDGQGGFKVTVQNTPVDMTNQPIKSNFIPD